MNRTLDRRLAGALLTIFAAFACSFEAPPPPLLTVHVPAGSTLDMSRPVAVQVTTSEAKLPRGTVGNLEVRRADGKVLYQGPVLAGLPLTGNVVLPTSQSRVTAILRVPGKPDATLDLAVSANNAVAKFE